MTYDQIFTDIFDYASGKADDIEILLSAGNSFSVNIFEEKVDTFKYADSKGISVRVILNEREGYAYTERLDLDAIHMIVDEAIENCRVTESDDRVQLANHASGETPAGLYSEDLDAIDVEQKIDIARQLETLTLNADERIFNVPSASFGDGDSFVRVANSKGMDKSEKQNHAYAYVGALAEENDEKRSGGDFIVTRDISEIDPAALAKKAAAKTVGLLNSQPVESGTFPVVFNNDMMATMLSVFSGIFSAKAVQEGRSLLKGKLDEVIANDKITLYDDALHSDGFATRSFDSEGIASRKNCLIEAGVLKTFLHNSITALKDGVESTGNGARGIKGALGVSTTNFYLEPGDIEESALFDAHDVVVEIVSLAGLHSGANSVSGDFSLMAEGYLYKDGVKQHSLKPFTVSGNFIQLLNDVELLADNFRFNMSSVGAPAVLINSLAISG